MSLMLLWFQEIVADGAEEEGVRDGNYKFDFVHKDLGARQRGTSKLETVEF